jgi:integrase
MPTIHLTERAIAKLLAPDPSGEQTPYWSDEIKGFGVLVSGTTISKSFIVQRTLKEGKKRKTRRLTVGAVNEISLDKAKLRAADMLDELRRGIDPKKKVEDPTLRTALESFLTARKDLAPASIHVFRQVERTLESWLDLPLRSITGDMIEKRHIEIAAAVAKGGRTSGQVTANGAFKTFRMLYNFAADRVEDLPPNPVRRLKRNWYPEPAKERIVPEDKMPEFYRALCNLPDLQRDYLKLLMFTGMRRTEAASLLWTDVDLNNRVIKVKAANTKNKKKLDLPITDIIFDMLVARRALGDTTYVFPSYGVTKRIVGTTPSLRAIYKETGVLISSHDLRRGYITISEATEISPMALKALVNHSLGSGITERYVQMSVERLREPAQRVADRIKALCGIKSVEAKNIKRLRK